MSKVSVIIPLFNKAKYVKRTLDSVFAQTYQDFEIMVVDDGSTDTGPKLAQSYLDPRLRIVHQENEGPGSARNRGIKETAAPYVTFLDADDEWLPEFLEKYLQSITANPECDYVVGPYFEGRDRIDKSSDWRELGVSEGVWCLPSDISHGCLHQLLSKLHCIGAMLCTRAVVERYGGFYSKKGCSYGEDRYLQMQLLLNHKFYRLVEPLLWYHKETIGVSTTGTEIRPLLPILTDPEHVRQTCPVSFRPLLESYMASQALGYALEYIKSGNLSTSIELIHRFPVMKKNTRKFAILICWLILAKLFKSLRW